jgi:hypothetical protein
MPVVKFPWDAQLISIRRDVCPRARWEKTSRVWIMTDPEAEMFLQTAQRRMDFARVTCTITVDETVWVLGFARDAPYRLDVGLGKLIPASTSSTEPAGSASADLLGSAADVAGLC